MLDRAMSNRVVVVGGGVAASRTCIELRKAGHDASIVLIGSETTPPYDRPPLSKAALHEPVDTTLPDDLETQGVELRLGCTAQAVDTVARRVVTDAGEVAYDCLVIATGAEPVRLPGPGEQHTLRTAQDAARLRARLSAGTRVTIAGGSWIGAEVATAALARGCFVTCVEAAQRPLGPVFGAAIASELEHYWAGVDLRTGSGVRHVDDGQVVLADDTVIESDVVVSGVGVRPGVGWLAESPIRVERGVLVDGHLRTSVQGVYAVGDVAAPWSTRWGRHLHSLHWDDAAEAPATLAAAILGVEAPPYDPVPYFWSDQFGHKLQYVGVRDSNDREVWRRTEDGTLCGVGWLDTAGVLTAYLAIDSPRDALHARMAIAKAAQPDPEKLADPAIAVRAA